jgi:hypothetical protein
VDLLSEIAGGEGDSSALGVIADSVSVTEDDGVIDAEMLEVPSSLALRVSERDEDQSSVNVSLADAVLCTVAVPGVGV